jgi:hypothetical protein
MENFIESDSTFKIIGYVLFSLHIIIDVLLFCLVWLMYGITMWSDKIEKAQMLSLKILLALCMVSDVLLLIGLVMVSSKLWRPRILLTLPTFQNNTFLLYPWMLVHALRHIMIVVIFCTCNMGIRERLCTSFISLVGIGEIFIISRAKNKK